MATVEQLGAPLEWDTPLFRTAIRQFEQALPYAEVGPVVSERLRATRLQLLDSTRMLCADRFRLAGEQRSALIALDVPAIVKMGVHPLVPFLAQLQIKQLHAAR